MVYILTFWKFSTWQHTLFQVCNYINLASLVHTINLLCQAFGDLAALHQGFERWCDRVISWNIWPSATLLAIPSSHSLLFISTSSKPKSTHKSFFFHRLFYPHPGPSGSHLFPNDFKSNSFKHTQGFLQKNIWQIMGSFSNHNFVFFILSFQSVILSSSSYLRITQTCNKQMICGKFNLLKRKKWDVVTYVLSLEEAYKSIAPVARMLWGEPHWGEQWLKIVMTLGVWKEKDEKCWPKSLKCLWRKRKAHPLFKTARKSPSALSERKSYSTSVRWQIGVIFVNRRGAALHIPSRW